MQTVNSRFLDLTGNPYEYRTVASLGVYNAARAANPAAPTRIAPSRPPLRTARLVSMGGGVAVSEETGLDAEGVTLEAGGVLLTAIEDVASGSTEASGVSEAEGTAILLEEVVTGTGTGDSVD